MVSDLSENLAWSRRKSKPVDIAGLVAMTEALYGLEVIEPPAPPEMPPPPPAAKVIHSESPVAERGSLDVATARF